MITIADKNVKIRGKEYVIQFPTVGQYYGIEAMKQTLGKGYYNVLLGNPTKTAQEALDMIDIEATVTILVPDLLKDMKVSSFSELGLADYKEIKTIYNEEIFPFIRKVNELLSSI